VDTPLTGFPISEYSPPYTGYIGALAIGDALHLVYNNGDREITHLESLETSAANNPLSGVMTKITLKRFLKTVAF